MIIYKETKNHQMEARIVRLTEVDAGAVEEIRIRGNNAGTRFTFILALAGSAIGSLVLPFVGHYVINPVIKAMTEDRSAKVEPAPQLPAPLKFDLNDAAKPR